MQEQASKPDKLSYYLSEYRKQLEKLRHIKDVLETLSEESEGLIRDVKIRSNQMGSVVALTYEGSMPERSVSRGRKSKWGSFIVHELKKEKRPLSYIELLDRIVKVFGMETEAEIESARKVIFSTCFRLKNHDKLVQTLRVSGKKGKFVALNKWYTPGGKLKKPYALKITTDHRNIIS